MESGLPLFTAGLYPARATTQRVHFEFKNGCEICCGAFTMSASPDSGSRPGSGTARDHDRSRGCCPPMPSDDYSTARYFTASSSGTPVAFRGIDHRKSCQELAKDYMTKTGDHWIAPIERMPGSNGLWTHSNG